MVRNSSLFHRPRRYSGLAIFFHWLLAALIIAGFCLGVYMHELPFSPQRVKLFNYHKWLGVTILTLSAMRLLWRLSHQPPPLPDHSPDWQKAVAHLTHALLYVLFFAVPLSGWAYSSAAGFPIVYLGVIPLPDFVDKSKELAETLKSTHALLAQGLGLVVLLHVAAAFKHQWLNKDGLMNRMLPWSRG